MVKYSFDAISLFLGLTQSELEAVSESAQIYNLAVDEYLYMQGDPADRLYVLESGKIKLSQLAVDGRQIILGYAGPGETFSVLAVLQDAISPVSAQAVEVSSVLSWRKADMLALMERYPKIAINAIRILGARTQEFQNRLLELATERVERRIARTLIRLARQTGRKTAEGVLLDLPLTRQDLAELSGTTLFTVSRTLSDWESRGLVKSRREQVVITFPHGLVQIAEDLSLPNPPMPDRKPRSADS